MTETKRLKKNDGTKEAVSNGKASQIPVVHPRYSDLISRVKNFSIIESTLRGNLHAKFQRVNSLRMHFLTKKPRLRLPRR